MKKILLLLVLVGNVAFAQKLTKDQLSGLYKLWDQEIIKDINDIQIFQILSAIGENVYNLNFNKILLFSIKILFSCFL